MYVKIHVLHVTMIVCVTRVVLLSVAARSISGEAHGPGVLQLRHSHHDHLAPQPAGRDGVQRLRPLLQAAQCEPAGDHATRHDTHAAAAAPRRQALSLLQERPDTQQHIRYTISTHIDLERVADIDYEAHSNVCLPSTLN